MAKWILAFCLFFLIVAFTPLRLLIPGYPDASTRRQAVRTAVMVDSLRGVIGRWELYAENLSRIVDGQEPLPIDSIIALTPKAEYTPEQKAAFSSSDTLLRGAMASSHGGSPIAVSSDIHVEGLHFFAPLRGAVATAFDSVAHPFVDISAPEGSGVASVLDGTVVASLWSDLDGYTIVIQHKGEIVSVYRHAGKTLKSSGDKVSAGETIAMVGKEASLSFELWYRGSALNPEEYIKL
ncbi:MAG: M23 family metallopeptidase [Bacteroidales bacterium]|nr:M23 family metallopeptidase [Bacteroidales bacterium]